MRKAMKPMSEDTPKKPRATLTIDGRNVGLNRFVENSLVGVIEGYLSAMKDIEPGEVVIRIPAEQRKP
ncbi:MAG: hypothetical protein FJX75_23200 [Armatimonadetes bacterium]|nr:hypothetical protein [Armatimonadota bacterium]